MAGEDSAEAGEPGRRKVIRTSNFVADAAALILKQARAALAERGEFPNALSGGNTPPPNYA